MHGLTHLTLFLCLLKKIVMLFKTEIYLANWYAQLVLGSKLMQENIT
jgi:hypothetical protein